MRHAQIRMGAVLLTLVVGASCSDDGDTAPTTSEARTEPATPSAAPVEVTACINPGPMVHGAPEERIVVPLPDGEMTIVQGRGATFRQSLTSVSDPRLEGTLHQAWDEDGYILPGSEPGPSIVAFTDRIENDEGAWQGSVVMLRFPDDTAYVGPMVMVGEGAYDGMTAIVGFEAFGDECAVRGYIIDGSVPPPPVPNTGQ